MNEALLEIRNLKTWFPIRRGVISRTVGHVRAVDDVTLSICPGETLGLVGESGCGKSTLGRTIVGLEKAHAGEILFEGRTLHNLSRDEYRDSRCDIQIIFQDPMSAMNPRMTVAQIVTEGLAEHNLVSKGSLRDEAIRLLEEVGLGAYALDRYPHEFSGGQRQRICVARALSMKPKLIICDEAVSALDVSVQAQVVNLFMELKQKHQLSYIFISHDLSVVRHIADRLAVMYLGRIVEIGESESIMKNARHPYTRALLSAIPTPMRDHGERILLEGDVPSAANPPPGCRFSTRCPYAEDRCRTEDQSLTGDSPDHMAACWKELTVET